MQINYLEIENLWEVVSIHVIWFYTNRFPLIYRLKKWTISELEAEIWEATCECANLKQF